MEYIALFVGKFFLYYGVCMLAPRLLAVSPADRFAFSVAWAALRLTLGVLSTYPILLLIAWADKSGLHPVLSFGAVMLLVRSLLWWLTARLIHERHNKVSTPQTRNWVFIGVCASFLVDAIAWLSGANFKFFC